MNSVKEKGLTLLKESIRVSEWKRTVMGSGYEFRLESPFASKYDIHNSILSERLFLDVYEGIDEEECEPTELEREEHFKEHQENVYNWGYESFLENAVKKYIHLFEEYVNQSLEILS